MMRAYPRTRTQLVGAVLASALMVIGCQQRPAKVGEAVGALIDSPAPQQVGYIKGKISAYEGDQAKVELTSKSVPKYNKSDLAQRIRNASKGDTVTVAVDAIDKDAAAMVERIEREASVPNKALDLVDKVWRVQRAKRLESEPWQKLQAMQDDTDQPIVDYLVWQFENYVQAQFDAIGQEELGSLNGREISDRTSIANGHNLQAFVAHLRSLPQMGRVRTLLHKTLPPAGVGLHPQSDRPNGLWGQIRYRPGLGVLNLKSPEGEFQDNVFVSPVTGRVAEDLVERMHWLKDDWRQLRDEGMDETLVRQRARLFVDLLTAGGDDVPKGHSVDGLVDRLVEWARPAS